MKMRVVVANLILVVPITFSCKQAPELAEVVGHHNFSVQEAREAKKPEVLEALSRQVSLELARMSDQAKFSLSQNFVFLMPNSNVARIIVTMHDPELHLYGASADIVQSHPILQAVKQKYSGQVTKLLPSLNAIVVSFQQSSSGSNSTDAILGARLFLEKSILTDSVRGDPLVRLQAAPNDTEFVKQWGLKNTGMDYTYSTKGVPAGVAGIDIGAKSGWDRRSDAGNVVIGMIDTGIQLSHPDLASNIWQNPGESGLDSNGIDRSTNGIDDDGNGYVDDVHGWDCFNNNNNPDDDNGHGTSTAGVAGAVANNALGVAGVAWKVQLAALKFLNSSGIGYGSDAAECLAYAINKKMPIVNASWTGDATFRLAIEPMIKKAEDAGVLIVAAAGNAGLDIGAVGNSTYPAGLTNSNVITVGSIRRDGKLSSFSNYSPSLVHVLAPGESIYTTSRGAPGYTTENGTSFAAPMVAGMAALMKAYFATFDPEKTLATRIRENLIATSVTSGSLVGTSSAGGYVHLGQALAYDPPLTANPSSMDIPSAGGHLDSCPVAVKNAGPNYLARLMLPGDQCMSGMTPVKSYEYVTLHRQCCAAMPVPVCVTGALTWARWLIKDAFGRQALAGEAESLATAIDLRKRTAGTVALAAFTNDEFYTQRAIADYVKLFKKSPETNVVPAWMTVLRSGKGSDVLMSQMMQAPEYFALSGGTNASWVNYIYEDLLGHPGSVSVVNAATLKLKSGATRASIALPILQSSEYRANVVIPSIYRVLLRRAPSSAEVTKWSNAMRSGMTPEKLQAALAQTPEYVQVKSQCPVP